MHRTFSNWAWLLPLGLALAPLATASEPTAPAVQLPAKDVAAKFLVATYPMNVDGTLNIQVNPARKGRKDPGAIPQGRVPRSFLARDQGGAGEPIPAFVLGGAAEPGTVVRGRILALLTRTAGAKVECRLVVAPLTGPFGSYTSLEEADKKVPGTLDRLKAGFAPTKEAATFAVQGRKEAQRLVGDAVSAFELAYITDAHKRPLDAKGNPQLYKWEGARNIGE